DYKVTGVQTCALPISLRFSARNRWKRVSIAFISRTDLLPLQSGHFEAILVPAPREVDDHDIILRPPGGDPHAFDHGVRRFQRRRSEERRVGKECRSRW